MGLDPSVYGGGGSPSSVDFPCDSGFCSGVNADLVSATKGNGDGSGSRGSSSGDGETKDGGIGADEDSISAGLARSGSIPGTKSSDENGGGPGG